MSSDCLSPLLFVRDLDYFDTDKTRANSGGNCNELNHLAQTCMPHVLYAMTATSKHAKITMSQLKSLSRLSLKPKRKASKRSATAGSRTRRDSATDDEDEEALTRQSSRSSISGRSSITSDRGRFYKLRPLERAGSSTRTVYHAPVFGSQVGSQNDSQVDLEDLYSSAGHTPFAATPSRMSISVTTPKETPAVELEGMSWENKPVPSPRPTTPLAKRGILKQKHSRQEIPWSPTDANMELHHRTSQCDKCGYGMGSALTPSVSQDRAMSELVARLHAAEVAAEVEVDGLQPNRLFLTDSGSSSDKSATGVTMKRVTSAAEQPTAVTDPAQQYPQMPNPQPDPATAHKVRRLSNPRASAETSAITLPAMQSTTAPKSRFHEDVPSAARSTPTLTMSPNPVLDPFIERYSAATTAAQLPTIPMTSPSNHMKHHSHPKPKPRVRFRTIAKVRAGLMGLWKKPKAVDLEQ